MGYSAFERVALPLAFLFMLLLTLVLARCLRGCAPRVRALPTAAVAVLLLLLELEKQRRNLTDGFSAYALPFHYCSLFVFFIPLAELGPRRTRAFFRPVAAACALAVTLGIYLTPGSILARTGELFFQSFSVFHSYLFHHLVILYLLLTLALGRVTPRHGDALRAGAVAALYAAVGIPLAFLLDSNYCNFLESVLPPLEAFRLAAGQVPYLVLVVLALVLGTAAASLIYQKISRLLSCWRAAREGEPCKTNKKAS